METQDVTLAIPKDILHELELFAKQRKMSLSRYVISLLEQDVTHQKEYDDAMRCNLQRLDENYEAAKTHSLALMATGFDMGTKGKITWTREELHARK